MLKTSAGGYAVQIPVDIDLGHHAWVVGRATRERRRGTVETEFPKVQFVDENIYDPDWIILSNVVIDAFGYPLIRIDV